MNTKLKVTSQDRISTGFLQVDRLKITLPNGNKMVREVLKKKNVVAIVALTADGKLFLTKQPRAGINVLNSIEIPAGLVEADENPEIAAERELREETGCVLTQPLISLGNFTGDPACCSSITFLYLALNVKKIGPLKLDPDEFLSCYSESIEKVYSMLNTGEIMDANSIIALERARKHISYLTQNFSK